MATIKREIEVEVDIDIEDHLGELSDKRLIAEVEDRGYYVEGKEEDKNRKKLPSEYTIKRCFDNRELREHLLNLAGLGSYVSNDELVNRIKELL